MIACLDWRWDVELPSLSLSSVSCKRYGVLMLSTQQKLRTPGWQDLVSLGFEARTESTKGMVVCATCVSRFDSDGRVLV